MQRSVWHCPTSEAPPFRPHLGRIHRKADDDRVVVGALARQHPRVGAHKTPREAAVEAQRHQVPHAVGREPRPDIAEARQEVGADDIKVA